MYICKQGLLGLRNVSVLLIWILLWNPMSAQDKLWRVKTGKKSDTIDRIELQEVVLIASKRKFKVASPMPVQILSGQQLIKMNSLSVADAIRYFSGVQLKDYGGVGGLKTINLSSIILKFQDAFDGSR